MKYECYNIMLTILSAKNSTVITYKIFHTVKVLVVSESTIDTYCRCLLDTIILSLN